MVQVGVESEDGWRPAKATPDLLEWVTVPGTAVTLQLMKGWPSIIMKAYAADYNAFVEPLRDADSAGFTPMNSVATSNHLNGTAIDLNWNSHPFQVSYAGYTPQMIATMREILDFYEDTMWWAQDWDSPKDCMHHQMSYNTWNNPRCADFISRKIRPDGFSTFRRDTPAAPPVVPSVDQASVLVAATGVTTGLAAQILPEITSGLIGSQCTTVNRIAMWLAQEGEESAGFTATVEIGNLDGTTYQGRTWEQITGAANYAAFSKWAFDNKIPGVTSPTYFVDNPAALGDPQYESLGATWYWTVARPQINALCDRGDVEGVTRAINGGLNGIDARTALWNRALAQGDSLLTLIQPATPGGWLMALTDAEQAELLAKVRDIHDQLGPKLPAWGPTSSMGTYLDGSEMTLRDGVAELKRKVEDPKVAIVTFQTSTPPAASK